MLIHSFGSVNQTSMELSLQGSGLSDSKKVEFYATDGKLIGMQKASSGTASIATSEHVVICKMDEASIKILVKK